MWIDIAYAAGPQAARRSGELFFPVFLFLSLIVMVVVISSVAVGRRIRRSAPPVSERAASTKPSHVSHIIASILVVFAVIGAFLGMISETGGVGVSLSLLGFWLALAAPFAFYACFRTREWARRNALDYSASQAIAQRLIDINSGRFEPVSDLSSGMRSIQGATVGEISQHFDQRVSASIRNRAEDPGR
jgi:hypothetical protein